jgi:hypothetical protein
MEKELRWVGEFNKTLAATEDLFKLRSDEKEKKLELAPGNG